MSQIQPSIFFTKNSNRRWNFFPQNYITFAQYERTRFKLDKNEENFFNRDWNLIEVPHRKSRIELSKCGGDNEREKSERPTT